MSFPPGEKVCLHCGSRLGRTPLGAPVGSQMGAPIGSPIDFDEAELEVPQRSGLLRTGLGSVWILLALTATCYRVCTG